ncbi:hypothetical protein HaLaN_31435, partial [Haematococcus lacustris]
MQMQVVQRLLYLLQSMALRGPGAAACLQTLAACARHSPDAALVLTRTPGLFDMLRALLLPSAPGGSRQP